MWLSCSPTIFHALFRRPAAVLCRWQIPVPVFLYTWLTFFSDDLLHLPFSFHGCLPHGVPVVVHFDAQRPQICKWEPLKLQWPFARFPWVFEHFLSGTERDSGLLSCLSLVPFLWGRYLEIMLWVLGALKAPDSWLPGPAWCQSQEIEFSPSGGFVVLKLRLIQ